MTLLRLASCPSVLLGVCAEQSPYDATIDESGRVWQRLRELLSREDVHDVVIERDADGLLRTGIATEDNCHDACDCGFHIRESGFGVRGPHDD